MEHEAVKTVGRDGCQRLWQKRKVWLVTKTADDMRCLQLSLVFKYNFIADAFCNPGSGRNTTIPDMLERMTIFVEKLPIQRAFVLPLGNAMSLIRKHTPRSRDIAYMAHPWDAFLCRCHDTQDTTRVLIERCVIPVINAWRPAGLKCRLTEKMLAAANRPGDFSLGFRSKVVDDIGCRFTPAINDNMIFLTDAQIKRMFQFSGMNQCSGEIAYWSANRSRTLMNPGRHGQPPGLERPTILGLNLPTPMIFVCMYDLGPCHDTVSQSESICIAMQIGQGILVAKKIPGCFPHRKIRCLRHMP